MSHELRTPLTAIIGFSEVLGERMFGLINDILDLSKIEAGRRELELTDFDLPTALDNALTLVRERAGRRGITLQLNVDNQLGQIQADERKVRQVVLNLLSNAIKFTPEGGRVEVAAVSKDGSGEVSMSDTGSRYRAGGSGRRVRGVPPGGDGRKEGGRHGAGSDALPEVRGVARRQNWGREPGGRRLDVHVHDPSAPWRMI
jgi:Histidine kinase-, DNA gyrase B-, and HSP90-like ATPase/His Kinase A (phospho-acceptor) domain